MPKRYAMFHRPDWRRENGKLVEFKHPPKRVRVLAEAEGYAMVRFPRAVPFVAWLKDLTPDQP